MRATRRSAPRPRAALLAVLASALVACTFPELRTEVPSPSPTQSPSPTATVLVQSFAPPTPTPEPTQNLGAVPDFAAGEIVASLIEGLRVRQRPGVTAQVTTGLLPLDAEMQVVMGPFPTDDFAWYLVTDADPDEPQFEEGWVAAGYEPDPFLRSTGATGEPTRFITSMSGGGPAEEGPVEIGEGEHAIRWIAADPEAVGCRFAVSLVPAGADPVPTIRATVGAGMDRGTLQPQTFAALGVRGAAFVQVDSDCVWALVILRPAEPLPSPTASG